ncbi:MAG: hypothetical protein LBL44_13520 [Treponema sp.]|jgi:hypothetical protein|nr:hypothetical protein [Treponema sp.]
MKKTLLVSLAAFLLITRSVPADTAQTLPQGMGRMYAAPTFFFVPGHYDNDMIYNPYGPGEGRTVGGNLGLAAEYGILDWWTVALRWAPGWNFASTIDLNNTSSSGGHTYADGNEYSANGVADIQLGFRFLLAGENAPVKSSAFRVSAAPGFKIPLSGPDFKSEYARFNKNIRDYFVAYGVYDQIPGGTVPVPRYGRYFMANLDKHVWSFSFRFNVDYVFGENFYLGFHTEFEKYISSLDANAYSFEWAGSPEGARVDFGYKLAFELEPVYVKMSGRNMFTLGLPLTVTTMPPVVATYENRRVTFLERQFLFGIMPRVSYMTYLGPLPVELELNYNLPVMGRNYAAQNSVTLLFKVYFGIPGAMKK